MTSDAAARRISGSVDDILAARVDEARALHEAIIISNVEQTPQQLMESLQGCTASQHRLEGILTDLYRIRARTSEAVASNKALLDDRWNEQAISARVGFAHEFTTGRERDAQFSLKTVDQQVNLRRSESNNRSAEAAVRIVELLHRGIRDVNRDIHARIRLLSIDSRLES